MAAQPALQRQDHAKLFRNPGAWIGNIVWAQVPTNIICNAGCLHEHGSEKFASSLHARCSRLI